MYCRLYFVPPYSFRRTCSVIFLPFFPSLVPSYFSAVSSAICSAVVFLLNFLHHNSVVLVQFSASAALSMYCRRKVSLCVACFFLLSKFYASAVLSMYFRRNASFVCCFLLSACSSSMCNFLPYSLKKSLRL